MTTRREVLSMRDDVALVTDGQLIWVEKWDGQTWISYKQLARELRSPTVVDGALVRLVTDERLSRVWVERWVGDRWVAGGPETIDEVLKGPTAGRETLGKFGYPTAGVRRVPRRLSELRATRCRDIPEAPGFYVVVTPLGFKPSFIKPGTGGHYKGIDPNVEIETLRSRWVPGARLLYVGKTDRPLRKRVSELLRFGAGKKTTHVGGKYLWQIKEAEDLLLGWCVHPASLEQERLILRVFERRHRRLPFANLSH